MKRSKILFGSMVIFYLLMGMSSSFSLFNKNIETTLNKNKLIVSQDSSLIVGVRSGLHDLDPHYAWDLYSFGIIEQVCEGLFAHNYSDPSNEIIPRLATDFGIWSPDKLNYTISINENVTFHDGTPFNASAVKWNFERLLYLMNFTGTLPSEVAESPLKVVYSWLDGTLIINRTEVIDLFKIKFVLNRPYGALEALLCFSGSFMLSPSSTSPIDRIDEITGELIGTGPFMFESHIPDDEMRLQANNNYWRAPPEIDSLIYTVIFDSTELNNALLNGDIDVLINPLPSYLEIFNESSNIDVIDQSGRSLVSYYIGMNNGQINQTYREVISYAIDYDYIINTLRDGIADRLRSPIPNGVIYSNYSLNFPDLNISHARELMQSMGYGNASMTDEEWEGANFISFNFTFILSSFYYTRLFLSLQNNLSKVGIEIQDAGLVSWTEYLHMLFDIPPYSRDMLQLFTYGWYPDFNDPSQLINVLYSNSSADFNVIQYNGGFGGFEPYNKENDVQFLMDEAISITDKDDRKRLYDKIQKLMIERDYPAVWLFTPKLYVAYNNGLEGFKNSTFCTIDDENEASLKGDLIYVKWKAKTTNGGPENGFAIPGYSPVIFGLIFLVSIYYTFRRKNKIKYHN
ncbi:MAG: ABC transporter substrate-binding protein [Candidatus Hodarchaeota archaeon]